MSEEFIRRIAITLGVLLLYRLGTYIPLPGINPTIWDDIYRTQAGAGLGSLNVLAGGGIHRLAIFALNIVPYVSAAIILQLAMLVSQRLRALARQGEQGRATIVRRTRYLTAGLAALQAWGIAEGLQGVDGVVANPGPLFTLSTVITLTGGTLVLVWLSEQITLNGIGNGIALLLFSGIVAELPAAVAQALELGRRGMLSSNALIGLFVLVVVVTGAVVFMELARRRISTRYAAREGAQPVTERGAELSLKLNGAGVVPLLLASWFLQVPLAFASFIGLQNPTWLAAERPLYLILYAALIILCAYLYTAFVLDPEEAAATLKRTGGSIVGIAPGEPTIEHLDQIVSRTTAIGAAYLTLIALLPEIVIRVAAVPFYFGGTVLLTVVCTALDLNAQVRGTLRGKPTA
jgi:preprotein translocase subunit SecY